MKSFVLICAFGVTLLCGCSPQKPHGTYSGRIGAGSSLISMQYDFRKDGDALFYLGSGASIVVARGSWKMEGDSVIFDGVMLNPKTKLEEAVYHTLHFDGADLFNDNLRLRLHHEN